MTFWDKFKEENCWKTR